LLLSKAAVAYIANSKTVVVNIHTAASNILCVDITYFNITYYLVPVDPSIPAVVNIAIAST
jgi:hypothetical protein